MDLLSLTVLAAWGGARTPERHRHTPVVLVVF
jgi:hypothetical protein